MQTEVIYKDLTSNQSTEHWNQILNSKCLEQVVEGLGSRWAVIL